MLEAEGRRRGAWAERQPASGALGRVGAGVRAHHVPHVRRHERQAARRRERHDPGHERDREPDADAGVHRATCSVPAWRPGWRGPRWPGRHSRPHRSEPASRRGWRGAWQRSSRRPSPGRSRRPAPAPPDLGLVGRVLAEVHESEVVVRLDVLRVCRQDLAPLLLGVAGVALVEEGRAEGESRGHVVRVDREDLVHPRRGGRVVTCLVVEIADRLERGDVLGVRGDLLHERRELGLIDGRRCPGRGHELVVCGLDVLGAGAGRQAEAGEELALRARRLRTEGHGRGILTPAAGRWACRGRPPAGRETRCGPSGAPAVVRTLRPRGGSVDGVIVDLSEFGNHPSAGTFPIEARSGAARRRVAGYRRGLYPMGGAGRQSPRTGSSAAALLLRSAPTGLSTPRSCPCPWQVNVQVFAFWSQAVAPTGADVLPLAVTFGRSSRAAGRHPDHPSGTRWSGLQKWHSAQIANPPPLFGWSMLVAAGPSPRRALLTCGPWYWKFVSDSHVTGGILERGLGMAHVAQRQSQRPSTRRTPS